MMFIAKIAYYNRAPNMRWSACLRPEKLSKLSSNVSSTHKHKHRGQIEMEIQCWLCCLSLLNCDIACDRWSRRKMWNDTSTEGKKSPETFQSNEASRDYQAEGEREQTFSKALIMANNDDDDDDGRGQAERKGRERQQYELN